MNRLFRDRSAAGIPKGFHGAERARKLLALVRGWYDAGTEDDRPFPKGASKGWSPAKARLRAESFGKCAYCESPAASVAHCDVEHFRPKSVYWWLAYVYDNYAFSCQICNQAPYKLDKFPLAKGGKPWKVALPKATKDEPKLLSALALAMADPLAYDGAEAKALRGRAKAEKALFVDPYEEDPSTVFAWEPDDVLGEVLVVARAKAKARGKACVDDLGLNREELRRQRYQTYVIARTFHALSKSSEARTALARMMAPQAPYCAMVRYFVRDVWELDIEPAEAVPAK